MGDHSKQAGWYGPKASGRDNELLDAVGQVLQESISVNGIVASFELRLVLSGTKESS